MNPASNLILVGPMGAGKSSIGRCLARGFDLEFVDLDQEIEHRTGASVRMIFDCEGETGFRVREHAALADVLAGSGRVLATGGGSVLDPRNRGLMRESGYVVYLMVSVAGQLQRLGRDRSRPLLASGDREAVLHRLAGERGSLYREVADLEFDTGSAAAGIAATRLARLLEQHWQRRAAASEAPQGSRSA
ncbi:shikimate kinase [Luteimonas sp. A277]